MKGPLPTLSHNAFNTQQHPTQRGAAYVAKDETAKAIADFKEGIQVDSAVVWAHAERGRGLGAWNLAATTFPATGN